MLNEFNCATREASQRLADAGIILETESYWFISPYAEKLIDYTPPSKFVFPQYMEGIKIIPAPCFNEIMQELRKHQVWITIEEEITYVWIKWVGNFFGRCSPRFQNKNPADALIDLKVWLSQKEKP